MSKVQIKGNASGTGIFTIAAPNTNTDYSITLPTSSATLATTSSPTFTGDVTFDTSTLVVDSTNNRVGIGVDPSSLTQHPDASLHVKGGINFATNTSAAEGSTPAITQWSEEGTGQDLVLGARSSSGAIFFNTGNAGTSGDWNASSNAHRMVIRANGNVGIGTDSPNERLSVIAEDDSSHYDNGFSIYRSTGDDKVTINAQGGGAKFIADGGSSYIPYRFFGYDGSTGSEWLTISSDGNVGIGESNPTTDLDVTGDIVASQSYRIGDISHWKMRGNNANTDLGFEYSTSSTLADANIKMVLKSSGNVGIGTNSPSQKFHVVGSLMAESTSGTGNAWTYYKNTDRTWLVGIRGSNSDALSFFDLTTDAERMAIDSSGRVTMPYQPSFHAYGTSNHNSVGTGGTKVDFAGTIHNVGNHYSTTNSRFTAPVAGRYLFSFMVRIDGASTDYFRTYVRKNGSASYHYGHQIQDWGTNWDPNYASMTGTVVYSLSANDYVDIVFDSQTDASVNIYQNESSWYGCLLY